MKLGDAIIIALVLAMAVAAFPLAASARGNASGVRVSGPDGVTSLAEDRAETLHVSGSRGNLVIEVEHGRARVLEADCPDQVCVRSGWSDAGRPVVCAPNGVVIESGEQGGELDAVSR